MQPHHLFKVQLGHVSRNVSLVARNEMAIFEKRSTTTKMESLFLWVLGNPKMKSMFTSTQVKVGSGKGV